MPYWVSTGTQRNYPRKRWFRLQAGGQREGDPMDAYIKTEVWGLAAGTAIAVSVASGLAYIIIAATI